MTPHRCLAPPTRSAAAARRLVLLLAATGLGSAWAQTSPYYIGVSETVVHDSNLYRLGDNAALPASVKSRSDTSYVTSLVGGIDQTWGRERLTGSASLRNNRYSQNDQLNYNGYGLNLGLDWASIERLSGKFSLSSNRSLRRFDAADANGNTGKNIENNNFLGAVVRVGVVTALTAEGTLSKRKVSYSSSSFNSYEYDQGVAGLALRYRLGGATTAGFGYRQGRTTSPSAGATDNYDRSDMDFTVEWVPSGFTNLYARLSQSKTQHDQGSARDFSGVTGELSASTQATGKIRLSTSLARDTGPSSSVFTLGQGVGSGQFDSSATTMRLAADYAATAKISVTTSIDRTRRNYDAVQVIGQSVGGNTTTTALTLGVRWLPTRASQLGCDIGRENRGTGGNVGVPYGSNQFSCYGQLTIQ